MKKPQFVVAMVAALGAAAAVAATAASSVDRIITEVVLEIGQPAGGAASKEAVLLPPVTVVVYDSLGLSGTKRYVQIQQQLRDAYRLEKLSKNSEMLDLGVGETKSAPSPFPGLEITFKLLAVDEAKATYEFRLVEPGKEPVASRVAVKRSEWGIVGGRDGSEAPYFFVLFRPLPVAEEKEERGWAGMTKPKVVSKLPPKYPEEARKAKAQDIIVLDLGISAAGAVTDAVVAEGEVAELIEAARQAALQWVFEPARDASGKAVACRYKVTIAFKLE